MSAELRWSTATLGGLFLMGVGACATTSLTLPEALEEMGPTEVVAASLTAPTELRAGPFTTSALEANGDRAPFTFTLLEGGIARARVRCIRSQAFVCSGDDGFPFFMRIPKPTPEAPAEAGELTIETVRFELRPQTKQASTEQGLPETRILGYEVRGPTEMVAALETDPPAERFWLGANLVPSLRRAVAATAFALRLRRLLQPVAPRP